MILILILIAGTSATRAAVFGCLSDLFALCLLHDPHALLVPLNKPFLGAPPSEAPYLGGAPAPIPFGRPHLGGAPEGPLFGAPLLTTAFSLIRATREASG